MTEIKILLHDISHRPWELPKGEWQYYQEWNNALFIHWEISYDILRKCVPQNLNLDSFDGKYYVSLVAFTMQNIRPRNLPAVSFISNFHEINIRTYIDNDNKKGVYFLNIEVEKLLSAFIAKSLSGLPYEKSNIKRTLRTYLSKNAKNGFYLDTEFEVQDKIEPKTELDNWLTERYCLYLCTNNSSFRYDIHHRPWEIKRVDIKRLNLKYEIGGIDLLNRKPELTHYSEGVDVLSWSKQRI